MPWFKRAPLHERLLAADADTVPLRQIETPIGPLMSEVGIHGVARDREWDCVVTVEAPGVRGDSVRFVTLENGDVVVEEGDETGDLGPLADAVEQSLAPPYRAQAVRQQRDVFAVGAKQLEVVELPDTQAESVVLTVQDGARELDLDGDRQFGGIPALERLGERVGRSYVVRADRVDGPLFEVRVDRL